MGLRLDYVRPLTWILPAVMTAAMLSAPRQATAQSGHRVTTTQITVTSASHWNNWNLPKSAVDVTPSGTLQPHFSRDRYDLLDDLDTFTRPLSGFKLRKGQSGILNIDSTVTYDVQGNLITVTKKGKTLPVYSFLLRPGISRVGSNPATAANILDGDPTTYWEPDPDDPVENWWVEVDLGRVVPVDSLVMHFVDPTLGDPFRQFRILDSPFQRAISQEEEKLQLTLVYGTKAPNVDQLTFSIPLQQSLAGPDWSGRLVETIRFVVSDTKGGRGRLLDSEQAWLDIIPSDRGDIVYFSKDQLGFEEPMAGLADYEALPPARQGRRDFYIRERPRLADIEAWGWGDNLSPTLTESGGNIHLSGGNFTAAPAFDADFSSNFQHLVWSPVVDRGVMTIDMGTTLWMDAIRVAVFPRRGSNYILDGYIMRSSDGARDATGELKWQRLSPLEREDNRLTLYRFLMDSFDPPRKMRFIETIVTSSSPSRRGGYNTGPIIGEYMLYSRGYPAAVAMESDLVEIQGRNPGRISWDADVPPGTNVEISTRTGSVLGKVTKYYDASGSEIPFSNWNSLFSTFKGPADTSFVPTTGWSSWSRPYQTPGERVTSPGHKKFLQIRVRMTSEDKDMAAAIHSINIGLLEPVAGAILAEMEPAQIANPGQIDTFTVFVQPDFIENPIVSRSTGFDELLLRMPASQDLELLDLGVGVDAESGTAQRLFRPTGPGEPFIDQAGEALQLLATGSDSIWVRLPENLNILGDVDRAYNRITSEGDLVPVSHDGQLLTQASYGVLPENERGDVRHFRQVVSTTGRITLNQVDATTYLALPEQEQGPIRYFRLLLGDGDQFPFTVDGDSLTAGSYNALRTSSRGTISGPGPLVVARFKAPVFTNGTTLRIAVRDGRNGTRSDALWQDIESGDATSLSAANTLTIGVPLDTQLLNDFRIVPSTITPNGDGINDQTVIVFSVFKISVPRQAVVRIYSLNGRLVWQSAEAVEIGREGIVWAGIDDNGDLVAPGLYICRLKVEADDADVSSVRTRVIAVAY